MLLTVALHGVLHCEQGCQGLGCSDCVRLTAVLVGEAPGVYLQAEHRGPRSGAARSVFVCLEGVLWRWILRQRHGVRGLGSGSLGGARGSRASAGCWAATSLAPWKELGIVRQVEHWVAAGGAVWTWGPLPLELLLGYVVCVWKRLL